MLLNSGLSEPWGVLLTCFKQSVVYHTAMKIFGYQTAHSAIFNRVAEYFYEFTMAHDVQEAFLVEVNYRLVALIIYLLRSS